MVLTYSIILVLLAWSTTLYVVEVFVFHRVVNSWPAACTCPGESHPGPMRKDGSYVGRAAPEIDVLEAIVTDGVGYVSSLFSPLYTPEHNSSLGFLVSSNRTFRCKRRRFTYRDKKMTSLFRQDTITRSTIKPPHSTTHSGLRRMLTREVCYSYLVHIFPLC